MQSMFSRLKTLLLPSLAAVSLLLSSGCGGTKTSYPGPEPITLTVEEPGEGVVLQTSSFPARGQGSKADALVACPGPGEDLGQGVCWHMHTHASLPAAVLISPWVRSLVDSPQFSAPPCRWE